jgi:hypothetical protein
MNIDKIKIRESGYCCDFYVNGKKFYADVCYTWTCQPECMIFKYVEGDEMTFDCDSCFSLHCQDDDEEVDRTNTTVLGCQTIANLEDAGLILSEVCAGYDTIFEFPDSNDAFEEI